MRAIGVGSRPPTPGTCTISSRADDQVGRDAVFDLELLGVGERRAQARGDVASQMVPAQRQHRGMHHGAAVEHDNVGGAAADIDQRDAQLALVGEQRRLGRGQRLEHHLAGRNARALAALGEILAVALSGRDDMDARLEPHARHPDRIAHAFLLIDGELLRQHVQDLAIERNRDCAGRIDYPIDVARADLAAAHRDDAVAVEPANMRTRDADDDRAGAHCPRFSQPPPARS